MREITAGDLMNPRILAVPFDMPIQDLAAFLLDHEITGAPVKDEEGLLIGVVSLVDLAAVVAEQDDENEGPELVADIMSDGVIGVDENAPVTEVAERMLKDHLHRVLVLRDGEAVGIVSTSDLLGLLVEDDERED